MVWIWDLIFVFVIACIAFGAIYAMAVRPTYATRSEMADESAADIGCLWLVFLFFLFFLPIWGGGLWLEPIGPDIGGSYVSNFIIIAVGICLFFGVVWAVIPGTEFSWDEPTNVDNGDGGWGALFWVFILFIILSIIFGYLWSSPHTMKGKETDQPSAMVEPSTSLLTMNRRTEEWSTWSEN